MSQQVFRENWLDMRPVLMVETPMDCMKGASTVPGECLAMS